MSDVMLCGILRMPFDDCGDIHLMQLKQACREAASELERRAAAIEELVEALKQLVKDYEDVPDPTDTDGQEVFTRARAALTRIGVKP